MPSAFSTTDGLFHQSTILLDGIALIRISVERLAARRKRISEWEWCVWSVMGPWSEPDCDWHGADSSLPVAKQKAIRAAVALLQELTSRRPIFDDMSMPASFEERAAMAAGLPRHLPAPPVNLPAPLSMPAPLNAGPG